MGRGLITIRGSIFVFCGLLFAGFSGLFVGGCSDEPSVLAIKDVACVPELKPTFGITLSSDGKSVVGALGGDLIFYSADASLKVEHEYQLSERGGSLMAAGSYVFIYHHAQAGLTRFDPKDPKSVEKIDLLGDADEVFVSPDARHLAVYRGGAGRVDVIDLGEKKIVRSLAYAPTQIPSPFWAAFFQDDRCLATFSRTNCHLSVWDIEREMKLKEIKLDGRYVSRFFVSPKGDMLITFGGTRSYVYSLPDLVERLEIETGRPIACACLRENVLYFGLRQQDIAWIGDAGCVCMYDFQTGKRIGRFRADQTGLDWIGISGDRKYLYTRGDEGLKSWDLQNILEQSKK
jgi:hypothetical protein